MNIHELLNESLISLYYNTLINEGAEDHPDAIAKCVTPQSLADDMNKEVNRLGVSAKDRDSRAKKDVIYHTKQIKQVLTKDGELDVDKFKSLITATPQTIFDKNPKMEKSDKGKSQFTVNTGLPAINGIVYDESDGQFKHINTCPGAGACQLVCYARKGFYGMNDGKILKLMRRLNLLWNNPEEYYNMIMDELEPTATKLKRQGRRAQENIQLVIRWNDAGDFFSDTYYKIAQRVTADLIADGFNVKSYAYTKQAKYMDLATSDFIMNFSRGAKPSEMDKVDMENTKQSEMVPREVFKGIFQMDRAHYLKDETTGLPKFVEGGYQELKNRISKEYKVPTDNLLYLNELPPQEGEPLQYNAIVLPSGDGDIAPQRKDVKITFLLIH